MGLFSRLFGGAKAPEPAAVIPTDDTLAAVRAGRSVDWDAALAGHTDDVGFDLLWQALGAADAAARVEVIDRLAEFELDPDQQRGLLHAAAADATRAAWVAISVFESCDVDHLLADDAAVSAPYEGRVAAVALLLGALVEAALSTGPAGDVLDLESGAQTTQALAEALVRVGATPAELVTLRLARRLCDDGRIGVEEEELGWDDALSEALEAAEAAVLARPPRGSDAMWADALAHDVRQASAVAALAAWNAATVADVDATDALLGRIADAPESDATWSVALTALEREAVVDALAPVGAACLQTRRVREGELCSLASQAGCQSCGGGDAADDDELMVPKALEARLLPLLGAVAARPGTHGDLVVECLAAPSIALRYNALAVLSRWQPEAIDAETWGVLDALTDDSVPQVQEAVTGLLERRPA